MPPSQIKATQPLKIIQVFNRYLQPGGEEKSVERIASDLETAGHHVVRFRRSSAEWWEAGGPPKWKRPFLMWYNATVLADLQRIHEREKPSVWILHNVLPIISLGVYGLARKLRVPIIQWLHNYRPISPGGALFAGDSQLQPEDRFLGWKEALAGTWNGRFATTWLTLAYSWRRFRGDFSSVAAWVAISEEMRNCFERSRWPISPLFTLRHSWHVGPLPPGITDEGYFLFLGRMVEVKGVRFLIRLWSRPELAGTRLIMAGEGPLVEELKAVSPRNVEWVGYVEGETKRRLIMRCRSLVYPCLWKEPLGLVPYEGYEYGKPIVASALGGLTETIEDGVTGRLLAPGDEAQWLRAIGALSGEQARAFGINGRKWLEENVMLQVWNHRFSELVEEIGIAK